MVLSTLIGFSLQRWAGATDGLVYGLMLGMLLGLFVPAKSCPLPR